MLSRIEDVLLRDWKGGGIFRETLFDMLDDSMLLLRLRSVSRTFYDLLNHRPERIFGQLYVSSNDAISAEMRVLARIAPSCEHLTITVASSTAATASRLSRDEHTRTRAKTFWADLLCQSSNVTTLTLRIFGDVGWPGYTDVEEELVSLRIAIEGSKIVKLQTFNLMPVHAMGIIHLQWNTLHSYGEPRASSAAVWERIQTLDLRINYSANLLEQREIMFRKQLYNYLHSFAPTLRCLRFIWLNGEGPSPLALHFEAGLEERNAIQWQMLEELWLGSITYPHRTIRSIPEMAPSLNEVKMLRSTHRDALKVGPDDDQAWIKISLGSHQLHAAGDLDDSASSVYSQPSSPLYTVLEGGVSQSSRVVPFMLDL